MVVNGQTVLPAIQTRLPMKAAAVLLTTLVATHAADDVPTTEIKSCDDGGVTITDFKACATPLGQPAVSAAQALSVHLCHDSVGLHVHHNATDKYIFSPWTHCNDNVFVNSDVLEVFLAPVKGQYASGPQLTFRSPCRLRDRLCLQTRTTCPRSTTRSTPAPRERYGRPVSTTRPPMALMHRRSPATPPSLLLRQSPPQLLMNFQGCS